VLTVLIFYNGVDSVKTKLFIYDSVNSAYYFNSAYNL